MNPNRLDDKLLGVDGYIFITEQSTYKAIGFFKRFSSAADLRSLTKTGTENRTINIKIKLQMEVT